MSRQVDFSFIVPVYNGINNLRECLSSLTALPQRNFEIIVVDDASTEDMSSVANINGIRLFTLKRNSGPAAARNYGAQQALGEVLFFVDADIVVSPDVLCRVQKTFKNKPEVAAVFGSYDAHPRAPGLISQYRNLMHHYVHQNGHSEASTFWAGCGAIRKDVFKKLNGFDDKRFARPSIEDIELGYRLREAGYRIKLDKQLQVTHLKKWTVVSFVKTDILYRALPWSRLILERNSIPNDLNLKWDQRVCFPLVVLILMFSALSLVQTECLAISAAGLLTVLAINWRIYLFFYRQRGMLFALACFPLHLSYYIYSGFSYLYVRLLFLLPYYNTLNSYLIKRSRRS